MSKIVEEPKVIGHKEINGEQVPVYSCKTETLLTHKKTGASYDSEEAVSADVADPNTDTKEEDIQRDVTIFAPRLGMGATNKKE
jgi:hypothetical protein|tara:strand:+ start:1118 stop:1369 length:252 start_codon:yes stop_codon:yes gene_type:complete